MKHLKMKPQFHSQAFGDITMDEIEVSNRGVSFIKRNNLLLEFVAARQQ